MSGALLCVVPYRTNAGFAWNYIEGIYAALADELRADGVRTLVAYREIVDAPRPLIGSAAEPMALDATLDSWASIRATMRAIRRADVRVVYFTDRGWWHWSLPLLRAAGVRRVVAHDHTSGARTVPRGLKRAAKWLKARAPLFRADVILTVSEYVARRHREVGVSPSSRVVRVWNGIDLPPSGPPAARPDVFGSGETPVVLCVCRAAPEKGVDHLLRAFEMVWVGWQAPGPRPRLVYVGDGPSLPALETLRRTLTSQEDVVFTGYRSDVPSLLAHATVSVVPSVWQDACPLGVLEPMAHGRPVIASAVGGVPEMIDRPDVGVLVPPGDPDALAAALRGLLNDPDRRSAMGAAARDLVSGRFGRAGQIAAISAQIRGNVWPRRPR